MLQFADFLADYPLVAHNASFDRKFLDAELGRIGRSRSNKMVCSMLTARRLYPDARNPQLGTLVRYCNIDTDGTFHRALADAEMTGNLWAGMIDDIKISFGIDHVSFNLMQELSRIAKAKARAFLEKIAGRQC